MQKKKRNLKMGHIIKFILGTCKIDKKFYMYDKVDRKGKRCTFVSEIYRNHYGHEGEFGRIWLTASTRQRIAAKLQQGISKEKNTDDIRESVRLEFQMEHLVDKRDLFNTEKTFRLGNISGTQVNGREVTIILLYFTNCKFN